MVFLHFLMFSFYREHAPSIIFMDEIDSIGSSRLEGGSGGENANWKKKFIQQSHCLIDFLAH